VFVHNTRRVNTPTAARIFHDWAAGEGLLAGSAAQEPTSVPAEMALVSPTTDKGKQLLRAKQIQAVAFNEPRREIIVFTRRALPASKKALKNLPEKVDDVAVVYRQGAQDTVGNEVPQPFGTPPYVVRQSGGTGRYTCGSSVSVGNYRDAGTLGCLVKNADGQLFGLSNNHVSGGCNFAGVGLPIVAPGIYDVVPNGLSPFTLGFHHAALSMVSGSPDNVDPKGNQDAAIFRIDNFNLVTSFQGTAYDTPSGVAALAPDLQVQKVGRTTGPTHGRVISQMHGAFGVPYNAPLHSFTGWIYFDPIFVITGSGGDLFADNGDSGALITTGEGDDRKAVGIVFAGMADKTAPGGRVTLALPIKPILDAFGVTLVSGHNV
jgi:hypothetical protein